MAAVRGEARYRGWSDAEVAADQALVAANDALGQADGLLNPALDHILAAWRPSRPSPIAAIGKTSTDAGDHRP